MDEPADAQIRKPGLKGAGGTRKGVETRARIIRGAREVLESGGIEALTTRKIAASANVRLATLHYYFDSKEAILLAVLDEMIADMRSRYHTAPLVGTPEERIASLLRLIWYYIGETKDRQLAQIELTLYALRTKGSEWLAERQYAAYIDFYSQFILDDPRMSEEDRMRISRAVARFMLIGIDGLILQNFALHDEAIARESVEVLVEATQAYLRRLYRSNPVE
ncbi:TetR/AcrR family transcriptional regulator [Ciceribacter sp. L1K22]|uniref:TetR/AcrR family transcriptional regulator n=1 Tax=Ciceribacter sp. L1K22 TaxID=2820275 RepID=UPI001ABDDF7E|nr:TetR/AcrR family transcriptional regulator [Ciceribacter sp. L1K22]MBO3762133.1 TetR/AcrR family transcriptional regulator [Ciceribacter sp. L1K22]